MNQKSKSKKRKYSETETRYFNILMHRLPFPEDLVDIIIDYEDYFQGKFIRQLPNLWCGPIRIATHDSNIYIFDLYDYRIKRINEIGDIISQSDKEIYWGYTNILYSMPHLLNMFIYGSKIYITGPELCVHIFTIPDLKYIKQLNLKSNVLFIHRSEIYIPRERSIVVYSSEGKQIKQINLNITLYVTNLYVDDNYLYIGNLDVFKNEIFIFSIKGGLQSVIRADSLDMTPFKHFLKIIVKNDFIYFCDKNWVRQCTKTGETIKRWQPENGDIKDFCILNGKCYVVNRNISVFE